MAEQLPIITKSHALDSTEKPAGSLLGRGLAAIQRKETGVVLSDLDSRYRQARDIYNRITDYGEETRFKVELLPTQEELLNEPLLKQLQPFYNQIKQLAEVFTVFQELANQGYGKAYFPLSSMYWGGQGVTENKDEAIKYSELAVEWCLANQSLNDTEIWLDIGCYLAYRPPLQEIMTISESCNLKFEDEPEYEQIYFWFHKAAEQGNAVAEYHLGNLYQILDDSDVEAFSYKYSEAAELNYAPAMYKLGLLYENHLIATALQYEEGFATDVSLEEAKSLQYKAAEQGYAPSQHIIGLMYENQKFDVWDEDEQAAIWYRKAAEQGYGNSQLVLGFMYEHGKGVDKNEEQAVFWYIQAANQNNKSAKSFLKKRGINWQES